MGHRFHPALTTQAKTILVANGPGEGITNGRTLILCSLSCVPRLRMNINCKRTEAVIPLTPLCLSLQDSPLIMQSDRNVTINARSDDGQLTGQLTVGKAHTHTYAHTKHMI